MPQRLPLLMPVPGIPGHVVPSNRAQPRSFARSVAAAQFASENACFGGDIARNRDIGTGRASLPQGMGV